MSEHGYLRLTLGLDAYAHAPDLDAFQRKVTSIGHPGGSPSRFVERGDLHGLVEAAGDADRAWRRIVERLARNQQYERAVFARVASVTPADGDPASGSDQAIPELVLGVPYVVTLIHQNPQLTTAAQAEVRLLPVVDELAASAVMAESRGLDGASTQLLLEPMRIGHGELEIHAIRGSEFLPVAWVSWNAIEPPVAVGVATTEVPEAPPDAIDVVLDSEPSAPQNDALVQPSPVLAPLSEAELSRQELVQSLVRAARLVTEALPADPARRIAILEELRQATDGDPRVVEQIGVALYEDGRPADAARALAAVPLDSLGSDSRSVLLAATVMTGQLPQPLERLSLADWTQPETLGRLLAASENLEPGDLLRLTEFLVDHLLSEDRSQAWLSTVIDRPLPRQVAYRLVERWQYVDPDGAARALERLVENGRLHLAEAEVARLAYDVAGETTAGLRIEAARAIVEAAGRNDDRDALVNLLNDMRRPERHVHREEFHELGDQIVRLVADVTHQGEPIDDVILAAADFIEDHRQAGELGRAAALAVFAQSNRSRCSEATLARLDAVLAALEAAQEASETYRRFVELQEAEANFDIRRAIGGMRFLLVGARRGDWWEATRAEIGLSDRTEWVESERGKAPPMPPIEAALKAGQVAGVIVFTSHIAHKTSVPVQKLAKKYDVPYLTCKRPSRDAFLASLREAYVPPAETGA